MCMCLPVLHRTLCLYRWGGIHNSSPLSSLIVFLSARLMFDHFKQFSRLTQLSVTRINAEKIRY